MRYVGHVFEKSCIQDAWLWVVCHCTQSLLYPVFAKNLFIFSLIPSSNSSSLLHPYWLLLSCPLFSEGLLAEIILATLLLNPLEIFHSVFHTWSISSDDILSDVLSLVPFRWKILLVFPLLSLLILKAYSPGTQSILFLGYLFIWCAWLSLPLL